jgi:energy-coupling factor transporter transmembrane protein EcfT
MVHCQAAKARSMRPFISPGLCFIGTLIGMILLISKASFIDLMYIVSVLSLSVIKQRSLDSVLFYFNILLPILVPLFFVHLFINPSFPLNYHLFGVVPIRLDGIQFSIQISWQLSMFMAISLLWLLICRDRLLDWLISHRFPLFISAAFAQSIAIIGLIERRGLSVYTAQQARGIQTGPGFLKKVKAFPSVMIPVIASVISEADHRAIALVSRGFASKPMSGPITSLFDRGDSLGIATLALPLILKGAEWIK